MKKKLIFSTALLFSLGLAGCGETATKDASTNDSKQEASAPAAKVEGKLTEEKFKQIKDGMTYEEVVKIVGAEGNIMSETGSAGEPHHTVMYEFETDGVMSSSTMMFQGGKLINKAQFGVETSDIEITLEQFNKLENGMSKEQVFDILGGEGAVLSESGDIVMYTYNGKSLGANASLMFQGDKLMNKTQLGLE
ncbi:DUF3862 domain-containing protein [Lysinibacillus fusiformis]|uniref:DUF3862 domain-containing protein n=1 Tax=Lysinibacillus fusiformis TaxID=28031 RepID=UPI00187F5716|nr:DUF3862 domain-containing protein [Lysinibacillus fusiformis]MBD8520553.1 DUF3862 domain-containing protein [Lysinibacillus fusiformis]MCR8852141.1 DUF3862 domain-containing protein [Lysinibacillus fusiformis]WKT78633.1 DUF3862 domain-containing protein [Lysinibacillus fusiformis]